MLFTQRKEFLYDPSIWSLSDTQVPLGMFDEYCRLCSPRPYPKFFEVDRSPDQIDPIYHMNMAPRTQYKRTLDLYGINQFEAPKISQFTRAGITYQRKDIFWLSNLMLKREDYFPVRGDAVTWNGYTYMVVRVDVPPECYWQQTGVWTGLIVTCVIPADGDALQGAMPKSSGLIPAQESPSASAG